MNVFCAELPLKADNLKLAVERGTFILERLVRRGVGRERLSVKATATGKSAKASAVELDLGWQTAPVKR